MPRIRARYAVKGPRKEMVTFTKCTMNAETKSLEQETVTEERECFMVYFPQGHSIRVTSFKALQELGFDKKPRMVDMDTGDVIDVGGDPYDFADNPQSDSFDVLVDDDEAEHRPAKTKVRSE